MRLTKISGLVAIALALSGAASAQANTISTAAGPFTPSFRGGANTTYFGWGYGTWDGNDDSTSVDVVNGDPPINPASLPGPLLVNNGANPDIVSGSNNLYPGPFNLTLSIPTAGTVGSGFTTIIIQGNSLPSGLALDTFQFGSIAGVAPTYLVTPNAETETQWWAKWELPGNQASYSVDISRTAMFAGVGSVTDMVVDTLWSPNGYASDVAFVPEPGSVAMLGVAVVGLSAVRRRRGA